jgi:transposase-like protein
MKNKKAYAPALAASPPAERSEAERSENERSGVAGEAVAARPDPEVVAKARRRIFTAEYKQRVLAEADQAKNESGAIGALLRREGLYSSHLVTWRQERTAGILHALAPQKRGPKSKRNPLDEENQKLRRENQRLTEELRKTEIVIDVQKKVAALLGRPILRPELEEKP